MTLSKLLSSNEALMLEFANPTLINRFLDMIRTLGPQPRLVSFFEAVCTVEGRAVKANQEMILRLTWMYPALGKQHGWRDKIYLKTLAADAIKEAPFMQPAAGGAQPPAGQLNAAKKGGASSAGRTFGPVLLPSGMATDGKLAPESVKKAPRDYIGKATFSRPEGFDPVFVTWSGSDYWQQGLDALFFSAKALNVPEYARRRGRASQRSSFPGLVQQCWRRQHDSGCGWRISAGCSTTRFCAP